MEDYLGLLLFLFTCQAIEGGEAVVIRLVAAGNVGNAVSEDLVVEGIQQDCPFPILFSNLEHGHVRNDDLNGFCCIPTASHFIRKDMAFFSLRFVCVLSGPGTNSGLLAALMS